MTKYRVGMYLTVDVEINDPNVIARVLENHDDSGHPQPRGSEGERGWADTYYPMSTRVEVLQHLAFNCVANGVGDVARLGRLGRGRRDDGHRPCMYRLRVCGRGLNMPVAVAFRCLDDEIVDGFRDWQERCVAWQHDVCRLVDEVMPGCKPSGSHGFSGRTFDGVAWDGGEPVPDGWRMLPVRGTPTIVPKRNTNAGKALAARLATLGKLDDPEFPGMLHDWWMTSHPAFRVVYPYVQLIDGTLWLSWACELEGTDGMGHTTDAIDPGKWERVKLSEFYAVVEAHDAETVDA